MLFSIEKILKCNILFRKNNFRYALFSDNPQMIKIKFTNHLQRLLIHYALFPVVFVFYIWSKTKGVTLNLVNNIILLVI